MGPMVPISVTLGRVDPPKFICLISKTRVAMPASWWPVRISKFIKQENGKVPALSRSSQRRKVTAIYISCQSCLHFAGSGGRGRERKPTRLEEWGSQCVPAPLPPT